MHLEKSGYIKLDRHWNQNDTINMNLEMPIERIYAHPNIIQDLGRIALQKGPIVYCLEEPDNGSFIEGIRIPHDSKLKSEFRADFLGGVNIIKGTGVRYQHEDWQESLYSNRSAEYKEIEFVAIPYYTWANRIAGEMAVWILEN
ncbi:MAG: hypothetical protein GF364_12130 [Candidatus Lokiarchaeota archaeon]|nr:hypothetical protein [Candidatus Lokiarchaeota archaeon]